jgi:hypothetical protein
MKQNNMSIWDQLSKTDPKYTNLLVVSLVKN